MAYCFVCGCEEDKNGAKAVPLCQTLHGHPVCFIAHQVFRVLNSGRADSCPSGEDWSIDWKSSMVKYVKPQVAAEVNKVLTLLESNGIDVLNQPKSHEGISQRVIEALKQGSIAFTDFLLL